MLLRAMTTFVAIVVSVVACALIGAVMVLIAPIARAATVGFRALILRLDKGLILVRR